MHFFHDIDSLEPESLLLDCVQELKQSFQLLLLDNGITWADQEGFTNKQKQFEGQSVPSEILPKQGPFKLKHLSWRRC